jgi:hypothetical protein
MLAHLTSRKPVELLRMSYSVLDDGTIDYKTMASQRIEPFLGEDSKKHPSVTFVSTTPGDIRRDSRTKSAIHRLSARIAALEETESLIHQARLVAEEELAFLRGRVAPISACPNEIIAKILVHKYSSARIEPGGELPKHYCGYLRFVPCFLQLISSRNCSATSYSSYPTGVSTMESRGH